MLNPTLAEQRRAGPTLASLFLLLRAAALVAATGEIPSYNLVEDYLDGDFFDKFNFWTDEDPSHGAVEYIGPYSQAKREGLVKMEDGEAYMGVDDKVPLSEGIGRRSVRIESKNTYNAGLFIASFSHTPTGCATWPAYWLYGQDDAHPWPSWGELDIIESVHSETTASANLHTLERCEQTQSTSTFKGRWASNSWTNCEVKEDDNNRNMGCPQLAMSMLGSEANSHEKGVGTWATEISPGQGMVRIWIWPKGSEPQDVIDKKPNPSSWGLPYHYFSIKSPDCGPHPLKNMRIVFNIDFCGDLAARSFSNACESIPEAQGLSCEAFVAEHPYHFKEAYWKVSALDVYEMQATTAPPSTSTQTVTTTTTTTATTTTTTKTTTTTTKTTTTTTKTMTTTSTTTTKTHTGATASTTEMPTDDDSNTTTTTKKSHQHGDDQEERQTKTETTSSTVTGTLTMTTTTTSTTSTSTTSTATSTSTTVTNTTTTATSSTTTTFSTTTITLTVSTTLTTSTTSTTSTTTSSTNTTTSTTATTTTTSSSTITVSTSTTTSTTSSTNTTTSTTETATTTTATTTTTSTSTTTVTMTQSRPNAITVHVDLSKADAFTYQCRGSGPPEKWHFEMAAWCCLHEKIGCRSKDEIMAELIAERGSTSTTVTTTLTTTSSTRTKTTSTSTTKTKTTSTKTTTTTMKKKKKEKDDDDDEDDEDENEQDNVTASDESSSLPKVITDSSESGKSSKKSNKRGADREVSDASGLVAVTERIGKPGQVDEAHQNQSWLLYLTSSLVVPLALAGAIALLWRARGFPKANTLRSWLFPSTCPATCPQQGWTEVPREIPIRQPDDDDDDEPSRADLIDLPSDDEQSARPSSRWLTRGNYSRASQSDSRHPLLSPRSAAFFEGRCDLEEGERGRLLL